MEEKGGEANGSVDSRATQVRFANPSEDIESLISGVRDRISAQGADLLSLFDTYAQEARFARAVFDSSLRGLPPSASVLEIGAGMMLLSAQLQREGFQVTALEPVGEGFSHFARLQRFVTDYAGEQGIAPAILASTAEALERTNEFDFAYSINVMEHVQDVPRAIERAIAAVKPGAAYRFVCPNYAFPYETHFNIPIVWNKAVTRRLLRKRIENGHFIEDPIGAWNSLNWIKVSAIRRTFRNFPGAMLAFSPDIFESFLDRALSDPIFQARRGKLLSGLIEKLSATGALKLTRLIPCRWLPVMDCTLTKNPS